MVEERLSDGTRIAQLLASEIEGLGGPLAPASVVDADPDVEPTVDGALAYRVAVEPSDGASDTGGDARDDTDTEDGAGDDTEVERIASVFVQPERARVEFTTARQRAADEAGEAGLRVRPVASQPPRTLVFVEDGAEVKRVARVFGSIVADETPA